MKKDSTFWLHQKVARAVVELWMSVTHAGDVFWCVGNEYFLRILDMCFKLAWSG